jgi:hypothetical protein
MKNILCRHTRQCFISLACTIVLVCFISAVQAVETPVVDIVPPTVSVNNTVVKLTSVRENLREKKFLPKLHPFPNYESWKQCDKEVDENLGVLNGLYMELMFSVMRDSNGKYVQVVRSSKDRCELFLALLRTIRESFDPNFDKKLAVFMNMIPEPDETDDSGQLLISGMAPEHIKNPKTREKYEDAMWKNSKQIVELNIDSALSKLQPIVERDFQEFVLRQYKEEGQQENPQLLDLMEKYRYPEPDKIDLLCKLKIPYKNFRTWESTDGLFKANAKFVSLDKKEVTLEKANGKQTTIELSALRKVDQDYVKEQLAPKPETPKTDSSP